MAGIALTPVAAWPAGADFLSPSRVIDADHPEIVRLAASLKAASPRETAIAIHDHVRDAVAFGWDGAFYAQRASEVLEGGVGYCMTKTTLFVALLRAAGIPARPHFVDLDAAVLGGLIDTGTPYVDHAYTEVHLGGAWVATDSYIADAPLAARAKARLSAEGRVLGYGVHADGLSAWDGQRPSFIQFVRSGARPIAATRDYGLHDDVMALYAARGPRWNRRSLALRVVFPWAASAANSRIAALRGE